jgi:hypothetical protein
LYHITLINYLIKTFIVVYFLVVSIDSDSKTFMFNPIVSYVL